MFSIILVGVAYLAYAVYLFDIAFNKYHYHFRQVWLLCLDVLLALALLVTDGVFIGLGVHVDNVINSKTDFSVTALIIVLTISYSLMFPEMLKNSAKQKKGKTAK